MSELPSRSRQVQAEARQAALAAISSEVESIVLDRMVTAGGNIAQFARFRSALGEVLGVIGTVEDIYEMALAGYQAMTIPRRMLIRVAAAHAFGYWTFQHTGIPNPLNPPNSFLVMHRQSDQSDRHIGEVTGNPHFSSDGGLTAADWNTIWRRGVQNTVSGMQTRMMRLALQGRLQTGLESRLGSNVAIRSQGDDATTNQYRVVMMCPSFGSPSAAAASFLHSSIKDAPALEREMNLRLYQRFPYNP